MISMQEDRSIFDKSLGQSSQLPPNQSSSAEQMRMKSSKFLSELEVKVRTADSNRQSHTNNKSTQDDLRDS